MTDILIHLTKHIVGWGASAVTKLGRYLTTSPPEKIHIKCVNEKCTAPEGIFEFDQHNLGTSGPAKPDDPDAREFVVKCPFCGTMNSIWLKIEEHSTSYRLGATIVKDIPLDFK